MKTMITNFMSLIMFTTFSTQTLATGPDCYPDDFYQEDPIKNPVEFEVTKTFPLLNRDVFEITNEPRYTNFVSFKLLKYVYSNESEKSVKKVFSTKVKTDKISELIPLLKGIQSLSGPMTIPAKLRMEVKERSIYDLDYCEYTDQTEFLCSFYLEAPQLKDVASGKNAPGFRLRQDSLQECTSLFDSIRTRK